MSKQGWPVAWKAHDALMNSFDHTESRETCFTKGFEIGYSIAQQDIEARLKSREIQEEALEEFFQTGIAGEEESFTKGWKAAMAEMQKAGEET